MKINKYLSGIAASALAVSCATAAASVNEVRVNTNMLKVSESVQAATKVSGSYIVQMRGAPAIAKASELGELTPSNQLVATVGNNYDATTPMMRAYVGAMMQRQAALTSEIGVDALHNYVHTFNGFAARLTPAQAQALRNHPDVAAVYEDEQHTIMTANTPAFLGLTGPNGQHTMGIKGEDVIVGILDTGIWPENPSFMEDPNVPEMAYGPAPDRWNGACNVGSVGEFTNADGIVVYNDETVEQDEFSCNNKLIGARYFGSSFSSVYEIQFGLGEFASPRDADGHGSHTGGTSAGNAGVMATLEGVEVGTISGIAPRARVAAYKVCWNSAYENAAGEREASCFFGDSMAAIDQAVVDGVDVLNYSIGNAIDINTPVYNAALRAASAGVFFAASAGNSGPGPTTVSNIAPWIATVGASTYDGESALVGNSLDINSGTLAETSMFSVHAAIGTPVPEDGLSGDLGIASPLLACEALTNDLTGQIALISRGGCAFDDKLANAEAAGAIGVIVYNTSGTPFAMGGSAGGINIPGVMISNPDGLALTDSLSASDQAVNVSMGFSQATGTAIEVGNIMAGFSSRGVNAHTGDILKPDITAPGVRILAANSPEKVRFNNDQGEDFRFLQGTSMSSPHIAGVAALLMGQHPSWSPAQVKSAIMTTAYQGVVKEDGSTPADPFDFGAGHVDPVPAMAPGLTYDTNLGDYLGFLCGQGEDTLVGNLTEGAGCDSITELGFATDASQLNYPSIAIAELIEPETVSRTVTDVTGEGGVYTVSVDAPAGTTVTVATFDSEGVETDSDLLEVAANGTASYALTIATAPGFTPNAWTFGSITLESSTGTMVRSPIAAFLVPTITIEAPENVSTLIPRGRTNFAVTPLYSGVFNIEYQGLTPASNILRTPLSDPGEFDFNAGIPQVVTFDVPVDSSLLRISLRDDLVWEAGSDRSVPLPGTNLDLRLYTCFDGICSALESADGPDANEDIVIVNPVTTDVDFYAVFIQGTDTLGQDAVDAIMPIWVVDQAETTTRVRASRRAIEGRFQNISVSSRGLTPGVIHMGTVSYFDGNGAAQGTTVLEVAVPAR